MVCTFFGHRNVPSGVRVALEAVLIDLIENKGADVFYVGNLGEYDRIVREVLRQLKGRYPHIRYAIVLAYMPTVRDAYLYKDTETLYPEGLERVPPKFAISKRNRWMVEQADMAITYVVNNYGGAAQFQGMARRKGKTVINLYEQEKISQKNPLICGFFCSFVL